MFVRSSAATALGRLGIETARSSLNRISETDIQVRVRRAASSALEELSRRAGKDADRGELLRRVDQIEEDNKKLREQLEELELKVDASAPEEAKSSS